MMFTPTTPRSGGIILQGGRYQNKVDDFASLCRFTLSAKKVEQVPFVLPMNLDMLSFFLVPCSKGPYGVCPNRCLFRMVVHSFQQFQVSFHP